jgi:hypothetical protein
LENTRKLEAMLLTLETSNTELETLKVDVNQNNVPSSTPEDNTDEEVEDNEDEEEKEKKNWFKKQIDGFTDSTEENHGLKNTARIA